MANIMQMMQKATQMKQKMQEMQERARAAEIEGAAGAGAVTCVITGGFELKRIKLSPAVVNADDIDMLEDLIVAAVNDARGKAEKMLADETKKIMSDAGLPPGLGLPF